MRPGKTPVLNLKPPTGISDSQQRGTLDFLQHLNQQHLLKRDHDEELYARIAAYELAFRMQSAAPEVCDFSTESADTLARYGIGRPNTQDFGQRCLLARRHRRVGPPRRGRDAALPVAVVPHLLSRTSRDAPLSSNRPPAKLVSPVFFRALQRTLEGKERQDDHKL